MKQNGVVCQRGPALLFFIFRFGPEKLPGLSRNGPQGGGHGLVLSEAADWALLLVTLHRKRLLPVVFLSCVSPESAKICLSLEVRKAFQCIIYTS